MKIYRSNNTAIDYKKAYIIANEFLAASCSITDFPFKMKDFLKEQSDIKIYSFSMAERYGVPIQVFGSESAIIMEYSGAYVIFYNKNEPPYRVRFSIMHEFGHYILGHNIGSSRSDDIYRKQELEANYFAAQMLMPDQILME